MTKTGGNTVQRPVTTTARRTTTQTSRPSGAPRGKRRRGALLRRLALAGKILVIPLFALAVVLGLAYVRLMQGPISLPFLVEPIQNALRQEFTSVDIRIAEVAVRLAGPVRFEFELKEIRVANAEGEPLAVTPSATIALSRSALLVGRIAPESVTLVQPRVLVFHAEDGNLSLSFSHASEALPEQGRISASPRTGQRVGEAVPSPSPPDTSALGRIDLVKVLSDASDRARKREAASAYLRELALKSATLIVDSSGRRSIWRVPELSIDLDHKRSRSSIAGRARMDSLAGPWSLNFRTFESVETNSLQLAVSVQGLVPRGLARTLPTLAVLESFDMPVWGEAKLDLSSGGEIQSGNIVVDAAPGNLNVPWLGAQPQKMDGAHLELSYDGKEKRFNVAPSVLVWGDSRVQFTGEVRQAPRTSEGTAWIYAFRSAGGWLAAEPPATQRLNLDDWSAQGVLLPDRARVVLRQFRLKAGGAEITAEGHISDFGGPMKAKLEGRLGPMSSATFRALWPQSLAPQSRTWVSRNLLRGQLQGGNFRYVSGYGPDTSATGDRTSLTLEAANVAFNVVDGWPALDVPRALVRLDGQSFELAIPDGAITSPDGRKVTLKGAFNVDLNEALPVGHVSLRAQGPASFTNELFDRPPFRAENEPALISEKLDGRIDAQVTLFVPLGDDFKSADIKAEGRLRILDGRMKAPTGNYDITSANITIDIAKTSADARGELLVNGVVAKVAWQHVFGAPPEKQPPLRISALLDNSYRNQLGLDINDLVQGDVALEVLVSRDAQNEQAVHVRADLLNAELTLDSIAWKKPKGRPALFEFDYAKGTGATPVELRNVKLVGDNVALEGWIGVGADNKVREYRFPTLSFNVVSSLEATGKMRPDGIWDVTARGQTFDGRELFRSFFDLGHAAETQKPKPGYNITAEFGTVLGHSETSLRNVRVSLQKRGHKVTLLDARGVFDNGKLFAGVIRPEPGQPRRLLAEATDAGQLFKLVGFYPNAVGGIMNLEVNLDGQGAAERTGTLWTRDFVILGDAVISEVLQNADQGSGSSKKGKGDVVREQFEFERLRIPFSVGHGQFVMHSGYINGPLVGATMRGKVDFRAQQLNVGGTYVPLSGLNRALAPIPLLGPLLTGPRGEGVLGITFAIQGAMSNPQVLVNPLSLVTPGIFREIMQMTPEDPKVLPRAAPPTKPGAGPRSSSTTPSAVDAGPGSEPRRGEVGGSWSAETTEPRKRPQ